MGYAHLHVQPVSPALGAEVTGVALHRLSDAQFDELRRAFLAHGVLFFRDQELEPQDQLALARRFGPVEVHPIVDGTAEHPELIRVHKPAGEPASFGVGWHSDNSFQERPSLGSLLYAVEVPPCGGDTLFASTERAYDALSPRFRALLDPLTAVHSARRAYDPVATGPEKYRGEAALRYRYSEAVEAEVVHPVVRTHPETGRRGLYVNPMFTLRIQELTRAESDGVLETLYRHCARPEFGCRFRWQRGSVAFWDNRCVQHYALDDYREFARVMHRVTIAGDRPV